jgi:uncharacterized surface protein with fasciclin (FAS1) repeats
MLRRSPRLALAALSLALVACGGTAGDTPEAAPADATPASTAGQAAVTDSTSMPDVVKVAVGSPDHTTLVAALKAANLVDPLANPGPFTVFAPTNAAFEALPKGTVESLLKPENLAKLTEILQHHVTTSARDADAFEDGEEVGMVAGGVEKVAKQGGAMTIGGAKVIASVRASNGWVHVIDKVLVPVTP